MLDLVLGFFRSFLVLDLSLGCEAFVAVSGLLRLSDGLDCLFFIVIVAAVIFGCAGGAALSNRGDLLVDACSGGFSSSLRDCCLDGALWCLGEAGLACFSSGVINNVPSACSDTCFFLAGEREGVIARGSSSGVAAVRLDRRGVCGVVVMVGNLCRLGW